MEYFLKISSKPEVKKWDVQSHEEKENVKQKILFLQAKFRNEVDLVLHL